MTIEKTRRCFVWQNQIWQLDSTPHPGLMLLETYSALPTDQLTMPDFLTIKRKVTDEPSYSMFNLSKTTKLSNGIQKDHDKPANREFLPQPVNQLNGQESDDEHLLTGARSKGRRVMIPGSNKGWNFCSSPLLVRQRKGWKNKRSGILKSLFLKGMAHFSKARCSKQSRNSQEHFLWHQKNGSQVFRVWEHDTNWPGLVLSLPLLAVLRKASP